MGCCKGMLKGYRASAEEVTDDELERRVSQFESSWKGSGVAGKPRGGDYDTITWRLFKIAHIQEAHKRKLGT